MQWMARFSPGLSTTSVTQTDRQTDIDVLSDSEFDVSFNPDKLESISGTVPIIYKHTIVIINQYCQYQF
jgi:hypothetical protein